MQCVGACAFKEVEKGESVMRIYVILSGVMLTN